MTLSYKTEVPEELVADIRLFIGDKPEFNRLIEGVEVSDDNVKLAVRLWLTKFNQTPPPLSRKNYSLEDKDFPAWDLLFEGVMIQILIMAGIVQSRNFLNFNDAGVSFTVSDKGQAYQGWIGMLVNSHAQAVVDRRVSINSEECFDIVPSPEASWYGFT